MRFVLIPPGTFTMGSPPGEPGRDDDEPPRQVTISKAFYLQTTEVTQGQWRHVMGRNPSYFKECGDDCPVERVSWNNVMAFIRRLNAKEGTGGYGLPTEAEWEYACRAGGRTAFSNGTITETRCAHDPNLDQVGWYCGNSNKQPHSVAGKPPNAWGLYDMHGNVWEWCRDFFGPVPAGPVTDPVGPADGPGRMRRGGGWFSYAGDCRSAFRNRDDPFYYSSDLGFRLARTP